jgi:CspA family cold shock protein
LRGNVKWFNNEKGYGFIEYLDGEDIFVHYTAIKQNGYKTLIEGQLVEFDLVQTEKGLQAINVTAVVETTV